MSDESERRVGADAHMAQLDGLRAVAVVGVLVTHFLPADHPVRSALPWGGAGVQLFFVLSGFLITGILLRCRRLMAAGGQGVGFTLGRFYARRSLRIFPLYCATIVVCLAFDLGLVRQTWQWHVPYLSNVGIVLNDGGFGRSTHFWTLAVEEQFYLAWPLLILLLPERWLPRAILVAVAAAPAFRLTMALLPVPWLARTILTPACLDTLAAGALLAWLWDSPARERLRKWVTYGAAAGGALIFALLLLVPVSDRQAAGAGQVCNNLGYAGVFLFVVDAAARGVRGPVGAVLAAPPLTFVGRISYGVYIVHHIMIDVYDRLGVGQFVTGDLGRFAVLTALSLALAVASWYGLEQPLNNLKSRFPYRKAGVPAVR